jgi:aquaporin Z
MKKYIAEAVGTFGLTLAVGLSLAGKLPIPTVVVAGLTLGLFVYSLGHVSGGHFNPAITLGAWSIKKVDTKNALLYLVFQFIGAAIAMLAISNTTGMPLLTVSSSWIVACAEALGTALFAFGVASAVYGKSPADASGVVVGGSLVLGISVAALIGSNGVLNPAVAFGIGSFNLVYALAPIVGSIVGMQAYRYLAA